MRLFGYVGAAIDYRDRAEWLTPPFDRSYIAYGPFDVQASLVYVAGATQAEVFAPGAGLLSGSFSAGSSSKGVDT